MPDITSVTVVFGHGIKREDFGPVKKAEVSITASVADGEMGEHVLASVSTMALAKVAEMLDAPKPVATHSQEEQQPSGEAPARRSRAKKAEPAAASSVDTPASAPTEESAEVAEPTEPAVEDEWAAGAEDIAITDQELLSATSKRAGELGARDPIVKLIATFATRTEGAPFKVQEIPANQRKDYLTKLAALTA